MPVTRFEFGLKTLCFPHVLQTRQNFGQFRNAKQNIISTKTGTGPQNTQFPRAQP
jgi:hypothetical protein